MSSVTSVKRESWDDALLTLLVEQPELAGEQLLAAVINEANDALARLKERGLLGIEDDDA